MSLKLQSQRIDELKERLRNPLHWANTKGDIILVTEEAEAVMLEAAVEIWKDADAEFIPAQQAREKLVELQAAA